MNRRPWVLNRIELLESLGIVSHRSLRLSEHLVWLSATFAVCDLLLRSNSKQSIIQQIVFSTTLDLDTFPSTFLKALNKGLTLFGPLERNLYCIFAWIQVGLDRISSIPLIYRIYCIERFGYFHFHPKFRAQRSSGAHREGGLYFFCCGNNRIVVSLFGN